MVAVVLSLAAYARGGDGEGDKIMRETDDDGPCEREGFSARVQLKHDPNVCMSVCVYADSEKEARRIFNLLLSSDAEVCDMQGMITIA